LSIFFISMERFMKTTIAMTMTALALLAAAPAAMAAPVALDVTDSGKALTGDPDHGKSVFNKCLACHSIKAGENRVGPSLNGVIGRTAGTVAGFNYSPANKNSGIVWSQQKIFDYLMKPNAMVPGTKMIFPGLPAAQDRADVIAYLKENAK
jgi:cytochrome c